MQTLDPNCDEQVTIEAETVEEALGEISTQLGSDAEIVRAQKVHRGGVGGFFAKEIVQLTARRRLDAPPPPPRPQGGGIAEVLERMAQDADAEDGDFRTALRREMEVDTAGAVPESFLVGAGWKTEAVEPAEDIEPTETVEPTGTVEPTEDIETRVEGDLRLGMGDRGLPAFPDHSLDSDSEPEPVAVGPVLEVAPFFLDVPAVPPAVDFEPVAEAKIVEPVDADSLTDPDAPLDIPLLPEDVVASAEIDEPAVVNTSQSFPKWRTVRSAAATAPVGMGVVDWSTTALLRLGIPAPVIDAVAHLNPDDDLAWIEAIAATVAEYCRPLPTDDVIVVGPHAERLAEPLGLPLVQSGDMAPYAGSFCAMVDDGAQDRAWLEYVQGGRDIHLVIGDESWQDLLVGVPVAVSWVGETSVADALYLAFTLGAALGYGTVDGFVSSMVRAQPTDVALAVRRIVGRR